MGETRKKAIKTIVPHSHAGEERTEKGERVCAWFALTSNYIIINGVPVIKYLTYII